MTKKKKPVNPQGAVTIRFGSPEEYETAVNGYRLINAELIKAGRSGIKSFNAYVLMAVNDFEKNVLKP